MTNLYFNKLRIYFIANKNLLKILSTISIFNLQNKYIFYFDLGHEYKNNKHFHILF